MSEVVGPGIGPIPEGKLPPKMVPPSDKKSEEVVKQILKSNTEFTTSEALLHKISKCQPFAKDKWVRLGSNAVTGQFYYVNIKKLSQEVGLDPKTARTLSKTDKEYGAHELQKAIAMRAVARLEACPSIEADDVSLLLLMKIMNEPQVRDHVIDRFVSLLSGKIRQGKPREIGILQSLLENAGISKEQLLQKLPPDTRQFYLPKPVLQKAVGAISLNDFKTALDRADWTVLLACLHAGCEGKIKTMILDDLKNLDRTSVYKRLEQWTERMRGTVYEGLFFQTLHNIAEQSPDIGLRKGAQNVIAADYQRRMIEASWSKNFPVFLDILKAVDAAKIPRHKLLKDFSVTCDRAIPKQYKSELQGWLLQVEIGNAVQTNNPTQVKKLLKDLGSYGNCSPSNLLAVLNNYTNDDPRFAAVKAFLVQTDLFCKVFDGSDASKSVECLYKDANNMHLDAPEVMNFALDLHKSKGLSANERTIEAKRLAIENARPVALPLAVKLYEALINDDQDIVRSVMNQVRDSGFAYDFHLFLQEAKPPQRNQARQEIVDRVADIYATMSSIPVRNHNMSPYELVKASIIAERELARTNMMAGRKAEVKAEEGVRTHVVDLAKRQVTFLNKAKGGKLYAFGTYKKVTSAITVSEVWYGPNIIFQAETKSEAVLRKNMFKSGWPDWVDEVATLEEFAGLEGLLSYDTVVNYTTQVAGIEHQRQALLLKNYDAGNFWDLKETNPSIENGIAYFGKIAEGLFNMHHYQELLPDGTKTVVPRVHGDIKPGNMLASTDGDAALVDYGFRFCPTKGEPIRISVPFYGTPGYSAPEVTIAALTPHAGKTLNQEALANLNHLALDSFAVGVSMFETAFGSKPPSMWLQQKCYQDNNIDLAKAEEIKKMLEEEYKSEMALLLAKAAPTALDEYQIIAWKMMHPDPSQRMDSASYLAEMDRLCANYPTVFKKLLP